MAQLYLPAAHTEADLVLASQIAEWIDSSELHVAWTPSGGRAVPTVFAELRLGAPRRIAALALVAGAVRELWSALWGRDARRGAPAPAAAADVQATEPTPGETAA